MRYVVVLALALIVSGLTGCVRARSTMLDDRTVIISGAGSAFNSPAEVQKAVLQEAAKKAQLAGYPFFVVTGSQDRTVNGTIIVPGQATTTGGVSGNCYGNQCSGSYLSQTTVTPPTPIAFSRPGMDIYVRFYADGQPAPEGHRLWSVASVLAVAK